MQDHLRKAQSELRKFKRQIGALQKEKCDLKLELDNANDLISRQRRGNKSIRRKSDDDMDVEQVDDSALRKRVKELELV